MKIDKSLELKFLKAIRKSFSKRSHKNNKIVDERNDFVDDHFILNEDAIAKLKKLNEKLRLEEERIFPFYKKLVDDNAKLVQIKIIDDFNFKVVISTFCDKHYKDLNPELEGNPIIETNCDFMHHQGGEIYFEDDWKDAGVPEGLRNFKHCYSFHHLYDHTNLTWYDLTKIEDIWFDIKIEYQFFIEIGN
jgi:hypothetical protein